MKRLLIAAGVCLAAGLATWMVIHRSQRRTGPPRAGLARTEPKRTRPIATSEPNDEAAAPHEQDAKSEGNEQSEQTEPARAEVVATEEATVVVTVRREGDPQRDQPERDVLVVCRASPEGAPATDLEAHTDGMGRAVFRLPAPCRVDHVRVAARAEATAARREVHERLASGARRDIVLRVSGGTTLEGRVVDTRGDPVPGAVVHAWCRRARELDHDPSAPDREATADAEGRFALAHVGDSFVVAAESRDLASLTRIEGETAGRAALSGLQLRVAPRVLLRGRVLDPDRNPLPRVEVITGGSWSRPLRRADSVDVSEIGAPPVRAVSSADGTFSTAATLDARYALSVSHAPFPRWTGTHAPADGLLEIVLQRGVALEGNVLRSDGSPAAGAKVSVQGQPRSTRCDQDGRFRLEGLLRENDAALLVADDLSALALVQPVAWDDAISLRLEPPLSLAGRVLDARREPAKDVEVAIEGDRVVATEIEFTGPRGPIKPTWEWAHDADSARTGADGSFRFERLYAGQFRVRATDPSRPELTCDVVARSGREDLELILDPPAMRRVVLSGRVTDAETGAPVEQFTLTPMRPSMDGMTGTSHEVADEAGAFEIAGLEPGRIELIVKAAGYAPAETELLEYDAGEYRLDFALRPWSSVRDVELVVRDPAGTPVPRAEVRFRDASGAELPFRLGTQVAWAAARTDQEGIVRASGLPDEIVTASVELADRDGGEESPLDLREPPPGPIEITVAAPAPDATVAVIVRSAAPGARLSEPAEPFGYDVLARLAARGEVAPITEEVALTLTTPGGKVLATGLIRPLPGGEMLCEAHEGSDTTATMTAPAEQAHVLMRGRCTRMRLTVTGAGCEPFERWITPEDLRANPQSPGMRLLIVLRRTDAR